MLNCALLEMRSKMLSVQIEQLANLCVYKFYMQSGKTALAFAMEKKYQAIVELLLGSPDAQVYTMAQQHIGMLFISTCTPPSCASALLLHEKWISTANALGSMLDVVWCCWHVHLAIVHYYGSARAMCPAG